FGVNEGNALPANAPDPGRKGMIIILNRNKITFRQRPRADQHFAACHVNPSHGQMVDGLGKSRYWGLWSLRLPRGGLVGRCSLAAVFAADRHLEGVTVLRPAYQAIFERPFCF